MSQTTEPLQELAPGIVAVIDWEEATMYLDLYPEATPYGIDEAIDALRSWGIEPIDQDEAAVEEQEDGAVRYWLAPIEVQTGEQWS